MAIGKNPITSTYSELRSAHLAHGVVCCLAILFWFPMGVFLLRLLNLKRTVRFHALWQTVGVLILLVGMGLGSRLSSLQGGLYHKAHPIIGYIVVAGFVLMPVVGWLHHRHYAAHGAADYKRGIHVWCGRVLLALSIVVGGTGLLLSDNDTHAGRIGYGVNAGVVGLAYAGVWWWSKRQRKVREVESRNAEAGTEMGAVKQSTGGA